MKQEHNGKCDVHRGCPRCRQIDDRWELIPIVFSCLVVFTFVIPVIPVIVLLILEVV